MPYSKAPKDHSEFGGGPGLIDPVLRADRLLRPEEERMEIMFTRPDDPNSNPEDALLGSNVTTYSSPEDPATAIGTVES